MTGLARKISDRVIQIFYPKGCSAADETSIFMEGENWKSDGLRAAQKLMKSSTLGHTSLVGNTRKGISNPFIINTDLIFTGCSTKFCIRYYIVSFTSCFRFCFRLCLSFRLVLLKKKFISVSVSNSVSDSDSDSD